MSFLFFCVIRHTKRKQKYQMVFENIDKIAMHYNLKQVSHQNTMNFNILKLLQYF